MPLSVGDRLGPYEIIAPIGKGGMGEVYRAHDPRTGRDVAIKISAGHFNERFDREVRAVAALNHPNICTLFDVGSNYLVMELVDGAPIAPTDDVPTLLDRAIQMADGMTAAHALGITHRDLKPGNILVTRDGRVKILDFGLAQVASDTGTADADPTLTIGLTATGTAIGTAAYMSPEQARGQKVDARSDLWSLGVILYEMATGARPFPGSTAPVIFEAILGKASVPVRERNPKIPEDLERIIARLLEKDRETRYQSAADVRADLKRLSRDNSATGIATPSGKPSRWLKYATAAGALVLIAGGVLWWQLARAKPLTDQDVLVLADFTNNTGDPEFDGVLRSRLRYELEQSPFLKIMDDEEVNQTLQLMGRAPGERISDGIAHDVCAREHQKATIGGSVASFGKNFQIVLRAINCQTGKTLAHEVVEAEDKDHVLRAVGEAATGMRAQLGESLSTIQKPEQLSTFLDVTTTSLEAWQAYARARDLMSQGRRGEAIPHLLRATGLDHNFAIAYESLSVAYGDAGDQRSSDEFLKTAFKLSDHVSERERLFIRGSYYRQVTHDLNKALEAYQALAQIDPRNGRAHNRLGGIYEERGEYEEALNEEKAAVGVAPRSIATNGLLMEVYMNLDRFNDAKDVAARLFAQKLDGPRLRQPLLLIAYIQDDNAAQEKEIQWFKGKPQEFQSLSLQAVNALVHGQGRTAKDFYQREIELERQQGFKGTLPIAFLEAAMGRCEAAHKEKLINGLLLCGDPDGARLLDEQDAKNPPENPNTVNRLFRRGEFEEILKHKGRNWGPFYSLSYMGLARAAAKAGDIPKARKTYQDFLQLWKDADEDAPNLVQAKKELTALR